MRTNARQSAAIIAGIAIATLVTQIWISSGEEGGLLPALWRMARFFTILTNTMVAISFALMAIRGRMLRAGWLAGITLWIGIVAVVYHLLLASQYDPQGLSWWTDAGLHTGVPVLTWAWWLAFAKTRGLRWRLAVEWLIWPGAYVIYAVARGLSGDAYPYFFIDLGALSIVEFLRNVVGLCFAFWLAGLGVIGLGRVIGR